jgi:hypothetical protein
MNESEQDKEVMQHEEPQGDSEVAAGSDPIVQEAIAVESGSEPVPAQRNGKPSQKNGRPPKGRKREQKTSCPPALRRPSVFRRIVVIAWSGEREPASDLWWAEATIEGEWVVVQELGRVRTRKEILERILALDSALVALDFNFSFPAPFLESLSAEGITDWRGMVRTIREDLKKNVDDGARRWVERMARYREAYLDPDMPSIRPRSARRTENREWNIQPEKPAPHEQHSMAERLRRTDLPLIASVGRDTLSTIQIGYNRLTERYEFNGNSRGRDALLGMAMLGQLIESGRDNLSIWPMMELKKLTIVEALPWLFTEGKQIKADAMGTLFANYEDAGWHIPAESQRSAEKSIHAQQVLFTLLGIVKTELRLSRSRYPIRFYSPTIYSDPQVQLEGWTYGMNYRAHVNGNDVKVNTEEKKRMGSPEGALLLS